MGTRRKIIAPAAVLIAVVLLSTAGPGAVSETVKPEEYEIKAGLILNFFKFTTWPSTNRDDPNLAFCILGGEKFGTGLETIKDRTVFGRKVAIRRLTGKDSLKGCNAVFIATSESAGLHETLKSAENHGVLTISDTDGFAGKGVMINLYNEGGHFRFEINGETAAKAGIRLSSKLLRLSRHAQAGGR